MESHRGKVVLLAIRKDEPTASDKQVEIGIYLGGKLVKSWTTAEFQSLGAKVERSPYGGDRAVFIPCCFALKSLHCTLPRGQNGQAGPGSRGVNP